MKQYLQEAIWHWLVEEAGLVSWCSSKHKCQNDMPDFQQIENTDIDVIILS